MFNENKTFKTTDFLLGLRMWLNKYKIPGILYFNSMGCIPTPSTRINTVIGKKMDFP
jgi:hypothetical protein